MDNEQNLLRNFTIAGRLWIIACICGGTGAFIAYMCELLPQLPPGRYPLIFFLVPVALGTLLVYGLGYKAISLVGIKMRRASCDGRDPE